MNGRAGVVKRRVFSPAKCRGVINLNAMLRTVDTERLDEKGEEKFMEYLVREFNTNILDQGFKFWKYNTKGMWMKELRTKRASAQV
jgi:hypothetical protein